MMLVVEKLSDFRIREIRELLAHIHRDLSRKRDRLRVALRFDVGHLETVVRCDDAEDLRRRDGLVLF